MADITDIPTGEGWLYLAVILDRFTRKIVGWAMREHMRAELTMAALTMAVQRRRPRAGLIHHADRGSQYAASDYRKILQAAAITPSMSRKPNCRDNAPIESVFGTLKTELVHQREYPDRDAARRDLFASIEAYYNRRPIHSAIGYITPEQADRNWGDGGTSQDQSRDESAKESFASASGVVHELEEAEIQRQLLLRDAPVWPQPGA